MREGTRKFADVQGTTATQRHPDADLNDYVNRGLGALHRLLTSAVPDQRYLSSTSLSLVDGTDDYNLPSDFYSLISVDLTANGVKSWLVSYEMHERAALTDTNVTTSGVPIAYRLRGSVIEYLPTPGASYTSTLWYVPTASSLASDGATFDTIARLDDYVIAFAARLVAVKDKNWDLVNECKALMAEMVSDIEAIGRSRDMNSPARVVDEIILSRWGRRASLPRRWR